jgi:hypothetical protein
MHPNNDAFFAKHLEDFKTTFCFSKTHKVDVKNVMIHELLNASDLITNRACSNSQ